MINIKLNDKSAEVEYEEKGVKKYKNFSLDSISEIFSSQKPISTPLLPTKWGCISYEKKNDSELYVLTREESEAEFNISTYEEDEGMMEELYNIIVPHSIWFILVKEEDGQKYLDKSCAFAIKHQVYDLDSLILYSMPLPNCNDNYICWEDEKPKITSSYSVISVPELFLGTTFNKDLSGDKINNFKLNERVYSGIFDMFEFMDSGLIKEFDYDVLIESSFTSEGVLNKYRKDM